MNSRERVISTINHREPDRIPIDFGATGQTGISAGVLYRLREALNLPLKPIEISEPFQMLGRVDADLMKALGCDVIGLDNVYDMFGNRTTGAKKDFAMPDGTPCRVHETFQYDIVNGEYYAYPQGDKSARYSAVMPRGGSFFDGIFRGERFDEDNLTPVEDYKEQYTLISEEDAKLYSDRAKRLYEETDFAIIGNIGGGGLGDAASLPAVSVINPKGIRNIDEFLMAHLLFPKYIEEVFEYQTQTMLKNLEIYKQAVGDKIQIVWISGTDFGTQNCEFIAPDIFRRLYKPFYKRINDYVHKNTEWKTFFHTCGSVANILPDIIEMGVDILNPVQVSAAGMNAEGLKNAYGKKITFWGGGVDTQKTLPFGTPDQVYAQVSERLKTFGEGGGFVFSGIHNTVSNTPIQNFLSMIKAVKDFNGAK